MFVCSSHLDCPVTNHPLTTDNPYTITHHGQPLRIHRYHRPVRPRRRLLPHNLCAHVCLLARQQTVEHRRRVDARLAVLARRAMVRESRCTQRRQQQRRPPRATDARPNQVPRSRQQDGPARPRVICIDVSYLPSCGVTQLTKQHMVHEILRARRLYKNCGEVAPVQVVHQVHLDSASVDVARRYGGYAVGVSALPWVRALFLNHVWVRWLMRCSYCELLLPDRRSQELCTN